MEGQSVSALWKPPKVLVLLSNSKREDRIDLELAQDDSWSRGWGSDQWWWEISWCPSPRARLAGTQKRLI